MSSGPRDIRRQGDADQGDAGQATLMIVGLAVILMLLVAVVIDSSSAYLQRQGLDNVADGAALHGADQGAAAVQGQVLDHDRLEQQRAAVRRAVADYLRRADAATRFPGLVHEVDVDAAQGRVTVLLSAPVDLPLPVPGMTRTPFVTTTSTAAVVVQR